MSVLFKYIISKQTNTVNNTKLTDKHTISMDCVTSANTENVAVADVDVSVSKWMLPVRFGRNAFSPFCEREKKIISRKNFIITDYSKRSPLGKNMSNDEFEFITVAMES